jgi:hypothetical protein
MSSFYTSMMWWCSNGFGLKVGKTHRARLYGLYGNKGLIPIDHEAKEAEVLPSAYSLKSGRDLTPISKITWLSSR